MRFKFRANVDVEVPSGSYGLSVFHGDDYYSTMTNSNGFTRLAVGDRLTVVYADSLVPAPVRVKVVSASGIAFDTNESTSLEVVSVTDDASFEVEFVGISGTVYVYDPNSNYSDGNGVLTIKRNGVVKYEIKQDTTAYVQLLKGDELSCNRSYLSMSNLSGIAFSYASGVYTVTNVMEGFHFEYRLSNEPSPK